MTPFRFNLGPTNLLIYYYYFLYILLDFKVIYYSKEKYYFKTVNSLSIEIDQLKPKIPPRPDCPIYFAK